MTWAFMFLILWKSCLLNCCWINTAASKARQCKPVSAASCQDSREGARVCRSYCFHILLLFIYTGRRSVFPCHPVVAWSSLKSWQSPGSLLPGGSLWSLVSGILGSGLRLQDFCSRSVLEVWHIIARFHSQYHLKSVRFFFFKVMKLQQLQKQNMRVSRHNSRLNGVILFTDFCYYFLKWFCWNSFYNASFEHDICSRWELSMRWEQVKTAHCWMSV